MISLEPIRAYLAAKPQGFDGQWLRSVSGASSLAKLGERRGIQGPQSWIVAAQEQVQHLSAREELATFMFDVVLSVTTIHAKSAGDDDELLRYRRAIKAMLLGFRFFSPEVDGDVQALRWHGGQVVEYTDVDLLWRDRYSFSAVLSNYSPLPEVGFFEDINPVECAKVGACCDD